MVTDVWLEQYTQWDTTPRWRRWEADGLKEMGATHPDCSRAAMVRQDSCIINTDHPTVSLLRPGHARVIIGGYCSVTGSCNTHRLATEEYSERE